MSGPTDAAPPRFADELEAFRGLDRYHAWIARQFEPVVGRRVLEVGCGIGNLSAHWMGGDAFVGVDADAACVAKCAARFGARAGVAWLVDEVGAPGWVERWRARAPDTLVAVNVLEHIADDGAALLGFRDVLAGARGGRLCLFVPAFPFALSALDRRYGHHRRYTRASLDAAVRAAGFVPEALRYFNAPGLVAWWTLFGLLARPRPSPAALRVFDAAVVPVARRVESLVEPPFGNSVVAVCRLAD